MNKFYLTFCISVVCNFVIGQNEQAIEAYNQGISAFNNKDFKSAIDNFDRAILLDSLFAKAYSNSSGHFFPMKAN